MTKTSPAPDYNAFSIHGCLTVIIVHSRRQAEQVNGAIKRMGQPGLRVYCIGDSLDGLSVNLALIDASVMYNRDKLTADDHAWLTHLDHQAEQVIYL